MQPFAIDSARTATQYRYQPLGHDGRTSLWAWWSTISDRIPAVLRPRPTWRYVTCTLVLSYVAYCYIFNLPFFAHPLPEYTGPYAVGAVDIEAPLDKSRIIHDAKFKKPSTQGGDTNAFEVETVLFTLYYPVDKDMRKVKSKSKHYWIPKPLSVTAEGYAKLAHIGNLFTNTLFTGTLGILAGSITIPAKVDAPLVKDIITPVQLSDGAAVTVLGSAEDDGLPVLVFTHGMASSRTDYTHWAGELASRGYVVAAIEHRDGSCPGSVVMKSDGTAKNRIWFSSSELEDELDMADFKEAQLSYRQAEIEETVKTLRAINAGDGQKIFEANPRKEGEGLSLWIGKINTEAMILAGHSYGATGALRALKSGPSPDLPFKGAIILDPGKSSGPLNDDISVPILIIHSNSWSKAHSIFYGRPHFEVVSDLVTKNVDAGHPSWFMTSLGTSHPSVTDAPLLEPLLLSWTTGAHIDVHEGLRQYVHISEDFLWFLGTGEKRNLLKEKAEFPKYDETFGWGRYKGQGEDWRRYWQIHIAPSS